MVKSLGKILENNTKQENLSENRKKLGIKYYIDGIKMEKLKNTMISRSKMAKKKMGMIQLVLSMVLVWGCLMQLLNLTEIWGPKVLSHVSSNEDTSSHIVPSKRMFESNGFLMVSSNGGLNQMRAGICDMVTIARYLNMTLVVPELDKTSFWNDQSEFDDIFDVNYFIKSLKDEVNIIKELPSNLKKRVNSENLFSMPPISWSNMTYYYNVVLPRVRKHTVIHFNKTDCRLANNGLPKDVQQFRCRVNYKSLRFTSPIEELGKRIVNNLKSKGPFLVLHLRYEMDMLAFSGCTEGCTPTEVEELTSLRYAYPWWKEKVINSSERRKAGLCPLTPAETALTLQALGIDPNIQIYIAAGDIYGGHSRLSTLQSAFPNLVKKETLLPYSDLAPFMNHSSQMAALDYMVSIESDIFVPTYGGNMAKLVEGHRRYMGYRKTINLDRRALVELIDEYKNGSLNWEKFSNRVKFVHRHLMGTSKTRLEIPGKPKLEDYFYSNPQECLPP
ncbi:hypothetical protein RND81_07G173600 [Saponaria officinalis]|uniref:O-fucosyltransferase family protein n=1 Tax=Saponaria officinalis TaxID=3572 RepID=A0AAW1JSW6_SAPOF